MMKLIRSVRCEMSTAPRILFRFRPGSSPSEHEHSSTAIPSLPLDLSINHARSCSNVCKSSSRVLFSFGSIKPAAIILDNQLESTVIDRSSAHRYHAGISVATNIAQGLLRNAVNLNLSAWRQVQFFVKRFVTDKLKIEFAVRRGMF